MMMLCSLSIVIVAFKFIGHLDLKITWTLFDFANDIIVSDNVTCHAHSMTLTLLPFYVDLMTMLVSYVV